jgi:hypothetical protein
MRKDGPLRKLGRKREYNIKLYSTMARLRAGPFGD